MLWKNGRRLVSKGEKDLSTPHKCPVCNGRGKVPAGFYGDQGTDVSEPPCRSCHGSGLVWSNDCPMLPIYPAPPMQPWPPTTVPIPWQKPLIPSPPIVTIGKDFCSIQSTDHRQMYN